MKRWNEILKAAIVFSKRWKTAFDEKSQSGSFGMLIEPVMIAVTGGIVGFVYVAFFMALFAIAGTK